MVKVENITKYYGNNLGIKNVSFEVKKNEIVGLLGKNGAGKTTIMNIITGYISATEGRVQIEGYDILGEEAKAKSKIGYLPEKPPVYMDMTVDEYLNFCADLKGVEKELRKTHLDEICTLVGIDEVGGRLCKNLSKGYLQRVGMGQALVGNPEILILDEPTLGLDPNQIIQIRQLIKTLGKKHTIIISSHILGEIAQLCKRIIIIDKGEIAASDTLKNLTNTLNEKRAMQLRIKNSDVKLAKDLEKIDGIISVDCLREEGKDSIDFMIVYNKQSDVQENIFNIAVKKNKVILMMKPIETTLEDVFLQITQNNVKGD